MEIALSGLPCEAWLLIGVIVACAAGWAIHDHKEQEVKEQVNAYWKNLR